MGFKSPVYSTKEPWATNRATARSCYPFKRYLKEKKRNKPSKKSIQQSKKKLHTSTKQIHPKKELKTKLKKQQQIEKTNPTPQKRQQKHKTPCYMPKTMRKKTKKLQHIKQNTRTHIYIYITIPNIKNKLKINNK